MGEYITHEDLLREATEHIAFALKAERGERVVIYVVTGVFVLIGISIAVLATDPGSLMVVGVIIAGLALALGWLTSRPSRFQSRELAKLFVLLSAAHGRPGTAPEVRTALAAYQSVQFDLRGRAGRLVAEHGWPGAYLGEFSILALPWWLDEKAKTEQTAAESATQWTRDYRTWQAALEGPGSD